MPESAAPSMTARPTACYVAAIAEWPSGSAAAWTEVLDALTPAERATIVATMHAYEAALDKHTST